MTHRFASSSFLPRKYPIDIGTLAGKVYRNVTYSINENDQVTEVKHDGPFSEVTTMHINFKADRDPPKPIEVSAYWNVVTCTENGDAMTTRRSTFDDDRTALSFVETDGDGHFRGVGLYKSASHNETSHSAIKAPELGYTHEQAMIKAPTMVLDGDRSNVETADYAVVSQWFRFGKENGEVIPLDDSITAGFPTVIAEPRAASVLLPESLFGKGSDDTHLTVPGRFIEGSAGDTNKGRRRLSGVIKSLRRSMSRGSSRESRSRRIISPE